MDKEEGVLYLLDLFYDIKSVEDARVEMKDSLNKYNHLKAILEELE